MSQLELQEYKKSLKEYKKEVTSTKETARKFLITLGVVTKTGRKTKPYKNLCIQQDQA